MYLRINYISMPICKAFCFIFFFLTYTISYGSVTIGTITDDTGDCNGAIELDIIQGETFPYTYAWTGPNGYTATAANLNNLCLGQYILVVTNSHGCESVLEVEIEGGIICTTNYTIVDDVNIAYDELSKTITKTQGGSSWNAGGATDISLMDGDYITFNVTANKHMILGLSYSNADESWEEIDYALYAHANGELIVYENQVLKADGLGTYTGSTELKIQVEGGKIKYYADNVLLDYQSTLTSSAALIVDFSLFSNASQIINLTKVCGNTGSMNCTTNYTIVDDVNIAYDELSKTITKTQGGSSWNAGGATDISLMDGDYITFNVTANKHMILGLSYSNADESWEEIDYALYAHANGELIVYENQVLKADGLGTYTGSTELKIQVEGGKIKYYADNVLLDYQSTLTSSAALIVDFSLFSNASQIINLTKVCGTVVNQLTRKATQNDIKKDFQITKVYPNPFDNTLLLQLESSQGGLLHIQVINLLGQTVYQTSYEAVKGAQAIRLNTPENLAAGVYYLQLTNTQGEQMVKRVVKGTY